MALIFAPYCRIEGGLNIELVDVITPGSHENMGLWINPAPAVAASDSVFIAALGDYAIQCCLDVPLNFQHGLGFNEGRLCVSNQAIDHVQDSVPFDSQGRVVITSIEPIAYYEQGVGFAESGAIVSGGGSVTPDPAVPIWVAIPPHSVWDYELKAPYNVASYTYTNGASGPITDYRINPPVADFTIDSSGLVDCPVDQAPNTYAITIESLNSVGWSVPGGTLSFEIKLASVPVWTTIPATSTQETNLPKEYNVGAYVSSPDGPILSYELDNPPAGFTLKSSTDPTIIAADGLAVNDYVIGISATNPKGKSLVENFTWSITLGNFAPVWTEGGERETLESEVHIDEWDISSKVFSPNPANGTPTNFRVLSPNSFEFKEGVNRDTGILTIKDNYNLGESTIIAQCENDQGNSLDSPPLKWKITDVVEYNIDFTLGSKDSFNFTRDSAAQAKTSEGIDEPSGDNSNLPVFPGCAFELAAWGVDPDGNVGYGVRIERRDGSVAQTNMATTLEDIAPTLPGSIVNNFCGMIEFTLEDDFVFPTNGLTPFYIYDFTSTQGAAVQLYPHVVSGDPQLAFFLDRPEINGIVDLNISGLPNYPNLNGGDTFSIKFRKQDENYSNDPVNGYDGISAWLYHNGAYIEGPIHCTRSTVGDPPSSPVRCTEDFDDPLVAIDISSFVFDEDSISYSVAKLKFNPSALSNEEIEEWPVWSQPVPIVTDDPAGVLLGDVTSPPAPLPEGAYDHTAFVAQSTYIGAFSVDPSGSGIARAGNSEGIFCLHRNKSSMFIASKQNISTYNSVDQTVYTTWFGYVSEVIIPDEGLLYTATSNIDRSQLPLAAVKQPWVEVCNANGLTNANVPDDQGINRISGLLHQDEADGNGLVVLADHYYYASANDKNDAGVALIVADAENLASSAIYGYFQGQDESKWARAWCKLWSPWDAQFGTDRLFMSSTIWSRRQRQNFGPGARIVDYKKISEASGIASDYDLGANTPVMGQDYQSTEGGLKGPHTDWFNEGIVNDMFNTLQERQYYGYNSQATFFVVVPNTTTLMVFGTNQGCEVGSRTVYKNTYEKEYQEWVDAGSPPGGYVPYNDPGVPGYRPGFVYNPASGEPSYWVVSSDRKEQTSTPPGTEFPDTAYEAGLTPPGQGENDSRFQDGMGFHSYPASATKHWVWFYDLNDLLAAKNGEKNWMDVAPYHDEAFLTPYDYRDDGDTFCLLLGGAYDEVNDRLYISYERSGADPASEHAPAYLVYSLNPPGA